MANDTDSWRAYFMENAHSFNDLLAYVEENYINNKKYSSKKSILLLNCELREKVANYQICDNRATERMVELGVESVAIEMENGCRNQQRFDVIYLTMAKSDDPVISFVYDYCQTTGYSKNSNVEFLPLNQHWGLQFEN